MWITRVTNKGILTKFVVIIRQPRNLFAFKVKLAVIADTKIHRYSDSVGLSTK